jgi:hypothetical protein
MRVDSSVSWPRASAPATRAEYRDGRAGIVPLPPELGALRRRIFVTRALAISRTGTAWRWMGASPRPPALPSGGPPLPWPPTCRRAPHWGPTGAMTWPVRRRPPRARRHAPCRATHHEPAECDRQPHDAACGVRGQPARAEARRGDLRLGQTRPWRSSARPGIEASAGSDGSSPSRWRSTTWAGSAA